MYSRTGSGGYGRDLEGGGRGGGGRYNDTNSNILEQQNNDRISELSDQVARLKVRLEKTRAPQLPIPRNTAVICVTLDQYLTFFSLPFGLACILGSHH